MQTPPPNRRRFLTRLLAAGAAPLVVPSGVLRAGERPVPSNRITLGVIGMGARGFQNMEDFFSCADAQITAVCDVDTLHYREFESRKGRALGLEPGKALVDAHYGDSQAGCATHHDFRELCDRGDLDAVVVATPDHWHAIHTLTALRSGKDVYCEKPVTHFFAEGLRVVSEVAQRQAIFQTGSQQRSDKGFRHAVEVVMNGHLGKLQRVEVGLPRGYPEPMASAEEKAPPAHLDYELWTGPAPQLPWMRARSHRFWRGHRAYGGGSMMDFIGHHNDIAHWATGMDHSGPVSVSAVGWTFAETPVYNAPLDYEILCDYPGGVVWSIGSNNRSGTKWIGDAGWLWVERGKMEASDPAWTKVGSFDPGPNKAYVSEEHHRNFIDGVKTRHPCVASAETAHRSITPGHLGYVAHSVGRKLAWDSKAQEIIGDAEAQRLLLAMSHRSPWGLG